MRLRLMAGIAGLVALVAASSAQAATIKVGIKNLTFAPATIAAHVGDTIEWDNGDFVTHTATARDKSWGVDLPAHCHGR